MSVPGALIQQSDLSCASKQSTSIQGDQGVRDHRRTGARWRDGVDAQDQDKAWQGIQCHDSIVVGQTDQGVCCKEQALFCEQRAAPLPMLGPKLGLGSSSEGAHAGGRG